MRTPRLTLIPGKSYGHASVSETPCLVTVTGSLSPGCDVCSGGSNFPRMIPVSSFMRRTRLIASFEGGLLGPEPNNRIKRAISSIV